MATTGNAAQGALEEPVLAGLRIPNNTNVNINNNNNTAQFGAVRDRLFHAMLIRFAVSYDHRVPQKLRQLFEFTVLAMAIFLLLSLVYVHVVVSRHPANCFDHIRDTWPREGVLRIEVINNLKEVRLQEELSRTFPQNKTSFNLKKILIGGPNAIPLAARFRRAVEPVVAEPSDNFRSFLQFWLFNGAVVSSQDADDSFWHYFLRPVQYGHDESDNEFSELARSFGYEGPFVDEERSTNDYRIMYEYVVEYSLLFGLLRLPQSYRMEKGIPYMVVQLDADEDECFGDWTSRFLMKHFIGYEELLLSSVKSLGSNDTDKGFVRDLRSGENYRFVTAISTRWSTLTALIVMLIFTFAISMLLRFSHHQIFLFIVDLLQMFELNQPLIFPAAPLLTVILALVGMEAIMSEVFNDTSTAFYVILMVWLADQYDAICCHSSISKRHWLRFFYLYHFAFYAYQYRFNGQYNGFALLTSALFVFHSMIFFFHHYEMPLILYQERLQHIIRDLQQGGSGGQFDSSNRAPRDGEDRRLTISQYRVHLDRDHEALSSGVTLQGIERERIQASIPSVEEPAQPRYEEAFLTAVNRTAHEVLDRAYREIFPSNSADT